MATPEELPLPVKQGCTNRNTTLCQPLSGFLYGNL
jgi:hypothetical protein